MGGRNITEISGQDEEEEEDDDDEMSAARQRPPAQLDWKKLGHTACVAFHRTPSIDFM